MKFLDILLKEGRKEDLKKVLKLSRLPKEKSKDMFHSIKHKQMVYLIE
jgi:hypothetical protein